VKADWRLGVGLVFALVSAACGSSDKSGSVGDSGAPPEDTTSTSDTAVVGDDTVAPQDTVTPVDTVEPVDTGPPPEGGFLWPCDDEADCDSGWCVASPTGLVCSKTCLENCPTGWRCAGVSRSGHDVEYVCLNATATLCQPCRDNVACNAGVPSIADRCVSYGDAGSFCGVACAEDGDCPAGYGCAEMTSVGGQPTRQCKPLSGSCECNPSGVALGMSTDCRFTNEHGTCGGARGCAAGGLTACAGSGASAEACNGVDDDCDGVVDEDIPGEACVVEDEGAACPGETRCVDGAMACVGRSPTPEECNGRDDDCNGVTDDGFPDVDDDGQADCVDPDDDDDGALDSDDCAPLDATIYPGAAEACNGEDDDCDGKTDEEGASGCTPWLRDADGDGHGSTAQARCLCGPDEVTRDVVAGSAGDDCDDLVPTVFLGAPEVCNGVDEDCDSETDEGVLSPCGGCSPVCLMNAGGDDGEPLDVEGDHAQNLVADPAGGVRLTTGMASIPFIWIANSAGNSVSRLDTSDGREIARYNVCGDPSRTAVDLNGDGIVACRGDGKVAKIAILEADCVDRNGNGVIDTSRDTNANGTIEPGERVSDDECILWMVQPDGAGSGCNGSVGCARAAGVDKDNDVWIGFWNSNRMRKLSGATGETLQTVQLSNKPYGLAITGDGDIWYASRASWGIGHVDPDTGAETLFLAMPGGRHVYGLAVDHLGKVWVATGEDNGLSRYDPAAGSWTHFGGWSSRGRTRGVAVKVINDGNGNILGAKVFVGHHNWAELCGSSTVGQHRKVSVIDAITLTEDTPLDLGADRGPVGVALDVDGNVWTVNQCTSNATKIDPVSGAVLGTFPVGANPYTYSDMTGYALRNITAPSGYYRQIFAGWDEGETRWQSIFVDATLPGNGTTYLRIRYRVAATEAGLQGVSWSGYQGPFPPQALPLSVDAVGRFIEVEVTLHTDDADYVPTLRSVSAIAHGPQ